MNQYYLPLMYCIITIFGLFGNITAISVYVLKMQPWKSSTIILLNLAVTDILYLLTLPFLVGYYISQKWLIGDFMCRFVRFGFHFNLYGSILFLTFFSIFRYVVVVHPLKAHVIQKRQWVITACFVVWIITFAEILPIVTILSVTDTNNGTILCLDFASSVDICTLRAYSWSLSILGFFIPSVIVCFCYTRIIFTLRKGFHAQSSQKKKARRLATVILIVFLLCFLPFHILRALRIESRLQPPDWPYSSPINIAYIASRPIAGLNTFFNLILYVLSGDNFQQALISLLKRNIQES
ncbi:2-oxoglutarate receptor 1-like [Protopterus annectens]|uniref:2-oxoglutarate receptor 1-like n=1 Tax=Protopterus annectens TaxID=7888 RepID=UPI001CFC3B02|nr:2-oxoglutarate receptor 1-like [Protopterus annectens]